MITDPYSVLGVSEKTSDADLKKAYRELSKKWHPDANPGNTEAAEERFKEIQEAYRQIVDARARGTSAYGPSSSSGPQASYYDYREANPYGNASGNTQYSSHWTYADPSDFENFFRQWSQYSEARAASEDSIEMQAALNYINNGYYREAMTALEQVAEANRGARWYFYAAHASQGIGYNINALNYAKKACDLEPENFQYQQYLRQLQSGGAWYESRGETYSGRPVSSSTGWCLSMIALNVMCNLCCPGSGFCI